MTTHPYTRLFILPSAPTVDEDETAGYEIGDVVLADGLFYDCTDATTGAAVWVERGAGSYDLAAEINGASSDLPIANADLFVRRRASTGLIGKSTLLELAADLSPNIDHTVMQNVGSYDHDSIDGHLISASNPHGVTAAQVGAVPHSLATAINDFLVASGAGTFVAKTLAQTITILRTSLDSIYAALAHTHAYATDLTGRPDTNYQTNDIFRVNSSGASTFSGTINGTPSGASVVYNAGFSGNENALVPGSTSQLAKLRLYNTTRGDSALISDCNIGTNTITLTATAPASWANGDTITIASQTVSGGSGNWVDLEMVSGLNGKTLIQPNVQFTDIGTVTSSTLTRFHPTEAFGTGKIFAVPAPISTFPSVATPWVKLISNVFTVSWIPSSTNTGTLTIRSMGVME